MRIIKFRGKHLCGQWYFGNLIVREVDSPVPETKQAYRCVCIGDIEDGSEEEVEENTIGQFTGLHDKNGKEIYEGDIIRSFDSTGLPIIHSILWLGSCAKFVAQLDSDSKYGRTYCDLDKDWIDEFCKEVIGNCWDTPELLKGGEK